MPLDSAQSAPGNRISGPDGNEYDVVARLATDSGPFVVIQSADPTHGLAAAVLVNEGDLRDNEDVAHVGTTAEAKADAYNKAQEEEATQREEDRQARIKANSQTTDATDATGSVEGTAVETGQNTPPTPTA